MVPAYAVGCIKESTPPQPSEGTLILSRAASDQLTLPSGERKNLIFTLECKPIFSERGRTYSPGMAPGRQTFSIFV